MRRIIMAWKKHGTKMIGFAQVTVGVLAVADGIFSEMALKYILLASGLLTAWRGFFNSQQAKTPP